MRQNLLSNTFEETEWDGMSLLPNPSRTSIVRRSRVHMSPHPWKITSLVSEQFNPTLSHVRRAWVQSFWWRPGVMTSRIGCRHVAQSKSTWRQELGPVYLRMSQRPVAMNENIGALPAAYYHDTASNNILKNNSPLILLLTNG